MTRVADGALALGERGRWEGAAALVLLLAALVVGGASQQNAVQAGLLEFAGLILIGALVVGARTRLPTGAGVPLIVLVACAVIPILQLIPAPPGLWAQLPGRAQLAADLAAAGVGGGWRPISVAPDLTLRSALALIPPAALFLVTLRASLRTRWFMALMIIAVALVSVVLGLLQVAGGADSALRFYPRTNFDAGVGFFANRNHFALLLVAAIPLVAAAAGAFAAAEGPVQTRRLGLAAALAAYIVLVVGVGVSHSRAALILSAPAMIGGLLILFSRSGAARGRPLALMFGAASLAAIALVIGFGLSGVASRFTHSDQPELRWQTAPIVVETGLRFAPLGAGVGAFDPVFRSVEPTALLGPEYLNHAHDDFLEVWLETGVPGLCLMAVALGWIAMVSLRAWRSPGPFSALPRAASLCLLLILAASAVDYPLRTIAQACIFAFACAVLAAPAPVRGGAMGQVEPNARQGPINVTPSKLR